MKSPRPKVSPSLSTHTPTLETPIFSVGTGRSGSTVFADTFALHPRIAFLTRRSNRRPQRPWLARGHLHVLDLPGVISTPVRRRLKLREAWEFWSHCDPVFRRPVRDLLSTDVTMAARTRVRRNFADVLTAKRDRLLVKLTGWPRIGYLNEIFPDAIFIHLVRDGRDVANS